MVESNHSGLAIDGVDVVAIRRYLAATDVRFAVLFGSRVRSETHDLSDVDVTLRFPADLSPKECFRRRNRIDTDLQEYADDFVDVSDIQDLPLPIAHAALQEGVRLVGDEREIATYRKQIDVEYEQTAADREWDRREFIDQLAKGDIWIVDEVVVATKFKTWTALQKSTDQTRTNLIADIVDHPQGLPPASGNSII